MTDRPTDRRLTQKQRLFVEAYVGEARGNATEAARLAGYKGNSSTLGAVGYENLQRSVIIEAIRSADESSVDDNWSRRLDKVRSKVIPAYVPVDRVYVIEAQGLGRYKIGHTKNELERRVKAMQTGSPVVLSLLCWCLGDSGLEAELHDKFKDCRLHGEWFELGPSKLDELCAIVKIVGKE